MTTTWYHAVELTKDEISTILGWKSVHDMECDSDPESDALARKLQQACPPLDLEIIQQKERDRIWKEEVPKDPRVAGVLAEIERFRNEHKTEGLIMDKTPTGRRWNELITAMDNAKFLVFGELTAKAGLT